MCHKRNKALSSCQDILMNFAFVVLYFNVGIGLSKYLNNKSNNGKVI